MKIKDIPATQNLLNVRFIYPGDGEKYYWNSQWQKGIWGKKDLNSQQIYPLFVDNLEDALEFEVCDEK